jgi:hypothetical protein
MAPKLFQLFLPSLITLLRLETQNEVMRRNGEIIKIFRDRRKERKRMVRLVRKRQLSEFAKAIFFSFASMLLHVKS